MDTIRPLRLFSIVLAVYSTTFVHILYRFHTHAGDAD